MIVPDFPRLVCHQEFSRPKKLYFSLFIVIKEIIWSLDTYTNQFVITDKLIEPHKGTHKIYNYYYYKVRICRKIYQPSDKVELDKLDWLWRSEKQFCVVESKIEFQWLVLL